jgi:hypothetical protein
MPSLVAFAADAPRARPAPPDVVVELPSGWVAFVDGDACDGVYVVVPKHPGEIADATFWSIPFHPGGVIAEERLADVCDYGAILDGAVATKQSLEGRFGRSLAAQPVSGFLYSASEGYALGTMLVDASRRLSANENPGDMESQAAHAFSAIGRHQRVLLGAAVKAKPEKDEAAFVRNIDFSYTLRRFELQDQGALAEADSAPLTAISPAAEAQVRQALDANARVNKCVAKIADRAGVSALALEVEISEAGDIASIEANAEGSGCFRKATKKGLAVEGWKDGAATVKILVPTREDTVAP